MTRFNAAIRHFLTTSVVAVVAFGLTTGASFGQEKEQQEEKGYEVYIPALPYHVAKNTFKPSTKQALARTSIRDYVTFLKAYANAIEGPITVVGHSMGALLAQLIAPHVRCERLIIISSAAPAGINPWLWSVLRTFGKNLFRFPLWRTTTELSLGNIRYGIAHTETAKTQLDILRLATYESGLASLQIGMGSLIPHSPTRVETSNIHCPVLVIGGTADRITPIRIQRAIATRFGQQAKLVEIAGASHWTIGGHFFPQIKNELFNWLEQVPALQHAA